ncbi:hypothetical protein HYQ45_004766 [Verticillium longisporum]|uniref:GST C-terminal domain-containing protein n=1 Tax=Verticillium longisporum TaxID=100787 RepID=A0A8I3AUA6_VERLO|nr:hypothetical protein HYQ45_004766 [Verticillium longisporum]PNH37348.1 hypothetical protein VD0004_g9441 [Verticillium dahliae]PNH68419.1 hypothetical protein VD0001_g7499 [Verticillium dahliae]RBQ78749.1 hypothetical protein VDGD_08675 [Verticillium dahliae]
MASSDSGKELILYHYSYSPYARRVIWYLTLRGIPYSQCVQPPILPRPDVASLGISYRRIPLLAIDGDVLLDTRLMLTELEALFPELPRLGTTPDSAPELRALERLLSTFTTETSLFSTAASLLPTDILSSAWFRDRAQFSGPSANPPSEQRVRESMAAGRPAAEAEIARALDFLEHILLADGRAWVLGPGAGPTLADIEAVWPFHWLYELPGALAPERFGEVRYPRVHAWIARFQAAVAAAKKRGPKTPKVSGEEAAKRIAAAPTTDAGGVDASDPVAVREGLKAGDRVVVWPTDTGSTHKDAGTLVALDRTKVVFTVEGQQGAKTRVHAPRHGFKVKKVKAEGHAGAKL